MLTRRSVLSRGVTMGAALAAGALAPGPVRGLALQAGGAEDKAGAGPVTGAGSLRAHAAAHGLLAGAAVNTRLLGADATYSRVLAEQYNLVVAETAMKWNSLRPSPDSYSFTQGDALVAFARQHQMQVRGHNFVWHEALPAWFAGTVTKENARRFLTEHILTVGGHYRGQIQSWDVVNEAVLPKDGRPDGLRNSPWMQLLGPEYIEIAFRTARQADPHALLTYNEYGIEYDSDEDAAKRMATLQLLRRLKDSGVPLDAVGIQSHIKAGSPNGFGPGIRSFIESSREMGLKVFITELDVNDDDLPEDDTAQRDRAVASVYRNYLNVVLEDPAVGAVLTWGFTDAHTWLNNISSHKQKRPNRQQRPLPFDQNYQPTEAFYAIRDAFDQRKA
ncbi:MAG TPA: endo-1,4-beta-xylanase [Acidobacteriaceae bacterium]|nr:endo-1,4-beta-xylanase [Acidobacteriaceae bacterium]